MLHEISIQRKLLLLTFTVSGLTVLLACGGFLILNAHHAKFLNYAEVVLLALVLSVFFAHLLLPRLLQIVNEQIERSGRMLGEERRVLQLIAKGASLKEVLDALTIAIERLASNCLCAILLVGDDKRHLVAGSGGSLPDEYIRAVSGLEIGPDVGACGSAAYWNQPTIVEDIATDHRFATAREFVMSFGLRSCWSVPIRDSQGAVTGTFAMYHRKPARPLQQDLKLVEAGAHLAGNAIERLRAEEKLRENAERFDLAEKAASFGIWQFDAETRKFTISPGFAALMGEPGAPPQLTLDRWREIAHRDDRSRLEAAVMKAAKAGEDLQTEFRIVRPDGSVRWLRSQARVETGRARHQAHGRRLHRHQARSQPTASRATKQTAGLKILLAEDNRVNQAVAVRTLEKMKHSVTVAGNGIEALSLLGRDSFDLILMDVQMPEMDGLTATMEIRKREKISRTHIPIVAMTAHAMKGDRERCLEAGMDGYVSKPINAKELEEEITKVVPNPVISHPRPPEIERKSMPTKVVHWNAERTLERLGGDENLFREIIGIFLEEAPKQMAGIRQALREGNKEATERIAHSLKGELGYLDITEVSQNARELEEAGRNGDLERASSKLAVLEKEVEAIVSSMRNLCQDQTVNAFLARSAGAN